MPGMGMPSPFESTHRKSFPEKHMMEMFLLCSLPVSGRYSGSSYGEGPLPSSGPQIGPGGAIRVSVIYGNQLALLKIFTTWLSEKSALHRVVLHHVHPVDCLFFDSTAHLLSTICLVLMNPSLCALDGHGNEDVNHTIKHSMPGILMEQKAIITGSISECSSCPSPPECITYLTQFHHIHVPGMPFSTLQL